MIAKRLYPVGFATGAAVLACSSLLAAQEFRTPPNFPSPPPAPIQQSVQHWRHQSVQPASYSQPSLNFQQRPVSAQNNPPQQATLLQQKLEHAQQLRAQMERAQREQGAPADFAERAYQAQQAYLAEQAFEEHRAYQDRVANQSRSYNPPVAAPVQAAPRRSVSEKRYEVTQAGGPPQPDYYTQRESANAQSTYSPPVHAAPPQKTSAPIAMSFGDQPTRDVNTGGESQQFGQRPRFVEPQIAKLSPVPQPIYRPEPEPAARFRPKPTYRPAPKPRLAAQVQSNPVHRPAPIPREATPVRANPNYQQASYQMPVAPVAPAAQANNRHAQVPRSQAHFESDFPAIPAQRFHGPNDPYILGEQPTVGLQDRITELLTKPRYRMFADRSAEETQAPTTEHRVASSQPAPRRKFMSPQESRAARPSSPALPSSIVSKPTPIRSDREVQLAYEMGQRIQRQAPRSKREDQIADERPPRTQSRVRRSAGEVQRAFEMEQRIENGSRSNDIRHAAMVAPVQDPFNDGVPRFSRQAQTQSKRFKSQVPAKQISILSGRSNYRQEDQESGESPFVFKAQEQANSPTEDMGFEDAFSERSDEELKRIDDELNRRLRELDSELAEEPHADEQEKSRLDQLEKDLAQESQGLGDSVLDDELPEVPDEPEEPSFEPVEKNCEQFRHELLDNSIRDIALDISPPASSNRDRYMSISRSWTDRSGNVIASGAMVDLRRGYVIIDGAGGRQKIPYAKLSESDLSAISDFWQLPQVCSVGDRGSATRNWTPQTYTWKASSLCHKPLFFENVQLERYGHSRGPFSQPVHSVAHFFVSLATVPYQTAITPANECQYALGYYRPGNCAPWLRDPVPISLAGAARQVAVAGFGGLTR